MPPGPSLPAPYAEFTMNEDDYTGMGQVVQMPVTLKGDETKYRTPSFVYDELGRVTERSITTNETNEPGPRYKTRTFAFTYDDPAGSYTRVGPDGPDGHDGLETTVQLDAANRVERIERGEPGAAPILSETRSYGMCAITEFACTPGGQACDQGVPCVANGLVRFRIAGEGSGNITRYFYDDANRLTRIDFGPASSSERPVLDYTYNNRGLPVSLTEKRVQIGSADHDTATVTFTYDNRGRLIEEERTVFSGGAGPYHFQYEYDPGGNRTAKIDVLHEIAVQYEYDVTLGTSYATANNRLMKYETWDTGGTASTLLSTTWYYYNDLGNVTRVVTNAEGSDVYNATRFGYARNGASVSFVLGETWQYGGAYEITYARQFRYDGARQRYLNRELDPVELQTYGTLGEVGSTWSDYDGDAIYGDRELINGNLENTASYEPGLGKFPWYDDGSGTWAPYLGPDADPEDPAARPGYYRSDLIGTTRYMSADGWSNFDPVVYTAFGERIDGFNHRYGYAGAWGYQSHSFGEVSSANPPLDPDTVFPYLHVGARYYDPTTGRFLQRDPIGIKGGLNVYAYVRNGPTIRIDPDGLQCPACVAAGCYPKKPRPPKPETPQEELTRIRRRLIGVAVICVGLSYVTPPPFDAIFGIGGAVAGGGAAWY